MGTRARRDGDHATTNRAARPHTGRGHLRRIDPKDGPAIRTGYGHLTGPRCSTRRRLAHEPRPAADGSGAHRRGVDRRPTPNREVSLRTLFISVANSLTSTARVNAGAGWSRRRLDSVIRGTRCNCPRRSLPKKYPTRRSCSEYCSGINSSKTRMTSSHTLGIAAIGTMYREIVAADMADEPVSPHKPFTTSCRMRASSADHLIAV